MTFSKRTISQCNHPFFQCILCSGVQVFWSHRQRKFLLWLKPHMYHICNFNITGKSSSTQGLFYSNLFSLNSAFTSARGSSVRNVECQPSHHQKLFKSIHPFTHIVLCHAVFTILCYHSHINFRCVNTSWSQETDHSSLLSNSKIQSSAAIFKKICKQTQAN